MKSHLARRLTLAVFMTGVFVLGPTNHGMLQAVSTAHAQSQFLDIHSSSAFGISANLSVLPLLGSAVVVTVPPTPFVAGNAPPAYLLLDSLATVSVPLLGVPLLETRALGVIAASVSTTVPGNPFAPPLDTPFAATTVADPLINLASLLTVNAGVIDSAALVVGSCQNGLFPVGATTITNAQTSGLLGLGLLLLQNPPPNTVLLDLLGIKVTLNAQTELVINEPNLKFGSIFVNALRIQLTNSVLDLLGVASGEIIIGGSAASRLCVR